MPLDNEPEWIRNLYSEIYPSAPIYPVGPRNTGTRVSGWQGNRSPIPPPMTPMPKAPMGNMVTENREDQAPIPDSLMPSTPSLAAPGGGSSAGLPPFTGATQQSTDVDSLLGSNLPGATGPNITKFLQSNQYRNFRGLPNQSPIDPIIRPQLTGGTGRKQESMRLGPSIMFGDPNRIIPPNERPMNPLNIVEVLKYLLQGNR